MKIDREIAESVINEMKRIKQTSSLRLRAAAITDQLEKYHYKDGMREGFLKTRQRFNHINP